MYWSQSVKIQRYVPVCVMSCYTENAKREEIHEHEHDMLAGLWNKDRRKITASPIATSKV